MKLQYMRYVTLFVTFCISCATAEEAPTDEQLKQVALFCDRDEFYHVTWDSGTSELKQHTYYSLYVSDDIPSPEEAPTTTVYMCGYECFGRTCTGQQFCPGLDYDNCKYEGWTHPEYDCMQTIVYRQEAGKILVLCGSQVEVISPGSYDHVGMRYHEVYLSYVPNS